MKTEHREFPKEGEKMSTSQYVLAYHKMNSLPLPTKFFQPITKQVKREAI